MANVRLTVKGIAVPLELPKHLRREMLKQLEEGVSELTGLDYTLIIDSPTRKMNTIEYEVEIRSPISTELWGIIQHKLLTYKHPSRQRCVE